MSTGLNRPITERAKANGQQIGKVTQRHPLSGNPTLQITESWSRGDLPDCDTVTQENVAQQLLMNR